MRFSRNLHRHRVAFWANAYIDYERLKTLLYTESSLAVLKKGTGYEIDIFDDFLVTQMRDIDGQISEVNAHWGPCVASGELLDYRGVSKGELEELQDLLLSIAHNIAQLDWYVRINSEAISRICQKAAAVFDTETQDPTELLQLPEALKVACSPCIDKLSLVNAALKCVSSALSHEQDGPPSRFLLLENTGPWSRYISSYDIIRSLSGDDAESLGLALSHDYQPNPPSVNLQLLLRRLLLAAITHRSYRCQLLLLPLLRSNVGDSLVTETSTDQDYLHTIIRRSGRSSLSAPDGSSQSLTDFFRQILALLHPSQHFLLQSQDGMGRLPLHYAAALGIDGICQEISATVQNPRWSDPSKTLRMSPDAIGRTPLDYAVRYGHTAVVKTLISECRVSTDVGAADQANKSELLATAISSRFTEVCMHLINEQWGLGFITRSGRNVLHHAAEQGLTRVVEALVAQSAMVDINSQETANGWTPLVVASIQGHGDTVKVLLQAGADPAIHDRRGWLAKDHASYLGFPKIADAIKGSGSFSLPAKPGRPVGTTDVVEPRRHAADSVIFINLGTQDLYKEVIAVDLKPYRDHISPMQLSESSLTLSISLASKENKQEYRVALPLVSDRYDWPYCFTTRNPKNTVIVFRVSKAQDERPIGTAVASLASLKENQGLGTKRESLVRDVSLPLVSDELGPVGSVVFTFLIANPLRPDLKPPCKAQMLRPETRMVLGGHRGNGRNDNTSRNLQLAENTLRSFQTAIDHGARVIEFDVQLTKDDVPVIHHDFHISENGMHTLTYKQFMAIGEVLSTSSSPPFASDALRGEEGNGDAGSPGPRRRRHTLCAPQDTTAIALDLRDEKINEPFVTLKELFQSLPEDAIFDIELKYPLLNEALAFQMDTFAPEINHFLDTVLAVTYTHAGPRRHIIFTSFNPDVCMVLSVKQQTYPILLLNNSSLNPKGDRRSTSMQMAVRCAHRFGLAGVAMSSETFVASPGLVGFARAQGLYTISWGPLNNDVECIKLQAEAGLDVVVVDRVRLVKRALDEIESTDS